MAYGPDNTRATKLVAAAFNRPGQEEPVALHRWFVDTGDARNEPTIAGEVAAFFKQYGVEETAVSDRIMGCPHEDGVDYPMGRPCPHCPFWAGIDRFTHEPMVLPAPTRSPEDRPQRSLSLRQRQEIQKMLWSIETVSGWAKRGCLMIDSHFRTRDGSGDRTP